MRVLTALDYAAESTEREYMTTPLSNAATLPHLEAYIVHRRVKVHVEENSPWSTDNNILKVTRMRQE